MAELSYLRFTIRPERAADFEALLAQLVEEARRSRGLRWVETLRFMSEPQVYVVLSEWESAADMAAFEHHPLHVRAVVEHRPHFAAPMVIRRYRSAVTTEDVWAKLREL